MALQEKEGEGNFFNEYYIFKIFGFLNLNSESVQLS